MAEAVVAVPCPGAQRTMLWKSWDLRRLLKSESEAAKWRKGYEKAYSVALGDRRRQKARERFPAPVLALKGLFAVSHPPT